MQTTEDLIRSVVHQVLSQMGSATPTTNGSARSSGQFGVYPTADAAVNAAEAAFQQFRYRPLGDRLKAVDCIRKICVENAEELGKAELEETKIGRLDHKIAKLRDAIPRVPGVEYLRTDNVSGDGGLTLTDYTPFGVIGAITPVTHSLPTLAGNAINMLASGNTVVYNAHPSGANIAAEGVRRFNRAIRQAIDDDLLTIINPPTRNPRRRCSTIKGPVARDGGPRCSGALTSSVGRSSRGRQPPVVVDGTACLENAAKSIVGGGVR